MATRKISIRECNVFQSLNDAEIEKILALVSYREYKPGEIIFQQGDGASELFVLLEGKIALQTRLSQTARRVTVDMVSTNEVFGWSAIVDQYAYTLTAMCLQGAKAIAINGPRFRALLRDDCHMGYEVMNGTIKVVASRLDETVKILISERLTSPGME